MSACAAQVFSGVSQQRFDCLVQQAATAGITINANQGQAVVKHGIVSAQIAWNYDPAAQTLTLQYLNPGFLAPCSTVNGMLHDLVSSCP
jgi:hypothetical protein